MLVEMVARPKAAIVNRNVNAVVLDEHCWLALIQLWRLCSLAPSQKASILEPFGGQRLLVIEGYV